MLRKMPILLLLILFLIGIIHSWIPLTAQSILYGISLSLKSVIIFFLPFLIFGLLFNTAIRLAKQASTWIIGLLIAICLSNLLSTLLSYTVGIFTYSLDLTMTLPSEENALAPLWTFSVPKLIDNSIAMLGGLGLGLILRWIRPSLAEKIIIHVEKGLALLLKIFLYIIPFFIVGFAVKMMHDGILTLIVQKYALIFAIVSGAVFSYIGCIYFFASHCQKNIFTKALRNMLPAVLAGFGSMSSVAAMPLTILGTEKNSKNSDIAKSVIPVTVNIHLIGDCFAIPIFAFAILKSFGVSEPSFISYLVFALYFVCAKFSVAAVPGGGILVMLSVLEAYLGFNGEMLSLITALYILFDPFITAANVLGNGGFAMGISQFSKEKALNELKKTDDI